ncbi:MAG: cytochrome b/b6 domain-containing protein [Cypionkella sp.]|uniref:cytochrome b n=1 Tax=Cypionkella sp. TaxID=2811411 RepID=UPI002AB8336A|nr:cytochrome b/b6 domain-containing protein [Cypionkella sp.]MDZ4310670.1 cytochrome b/b6 domain-containing protein [Cypionkella sp.]
MSTLKGYSVTQIALHWIVAALIVFQMIFGDAMGSAWRAVREGLAPDMTLAVWAHIIAGIAVLLFVVWRLALRFTRGAPEAPAASVMMMQAAKWGHRALYAAMVLAPISGLMAWYGGVESAAEVHELFKPVLILLVLGHVLAALYHQFIRKDGLLLRMKRPLD